MDYKTDSDEPGTTVTPQDSIDVRILSTLAATLNFTYEIREQRERKWGVPTNGEFNGMIGDLQREESDFCMIAAPTPERLQVIDYTKGYTPDVMIVLSLKPTLLPESLALIRPFLGEVWIALVVSVVAWGVILWLLQRAWRRWGSGESGVKFSTALLYGWGALLEHPPTDPSVSVSGQMLVGCWLVFCLVINTAFRSSLVAHLTVQGKSRSPESFRDLVERDDWMWGSEGWFLTGVPLEYFSKHTDPVVQHIYEEMEVLTVEEAFQKVLAGSYSFITFKNYANVIIASSYTDSLGNSPFYLGKEEIPVFVVSGWGFRKGAPFHLRFSELMYRLEDVGIVNHWIEDVIERRVRENREAAALVAHEKMESEDNKQTPLRLQHLQGAFYLLLFGFGVGLFTLLGEDLAHSRL
ncbi:probable glutamate receptor [Panulirus ornatus]|uniref:probable glutamate receptor n=1 Tax=Panulirus ornatus TaxID=150431 RepID=UPI003A8A1C13